MCVCVCVCVSSMIFYTNGNPTFFFTPLTAPQNALLILSHSLGEQPVDFCVKKKENYIFFLNL